MVLLHDVFDLVEVLLGQLVAVLEYRPDFVVNHVERVKVLFLEMPLFGLINEQWYFVGDFFIVFNGNLHSPVLHVDHFEELERQLATLALEPWSYVLVLAVLAQLLFLEIPIRLR